MYPGVQVQLNNMPPGSFDMQVPPFKQVAELQGLGTETK